MDNKAPNLLQEAIKYVITEDSGFVAQSVNLPSMIVQGDSLDELDRKLRILLKMHINHLTEILEQPSPFSYYQVNDLLSEINTKLMKPTSLNN